MTRHINLHLPQSWSQCTTEELEHIAAAIVSEQANIGRYRPFNWERVKLSIALSINSLTPNPSPVREGSGHSSDIESEWMVQRPDDKEPWPISTGQLCSLCEMLNWIDDEKASKVIFQFPYPTLDVRCKKEDVRRKTSQTSYLFPLPSAIIHLQGPPPLLDGYTWQEYRWLTDWMQEYMRCANALAQSKREDVRRKNAEAAAQAQREFLAILFKPTSPPTPLRGEGSEEMKRMFNDFSPIKWQVILFWWSSLMWQLAKKFPRVFKSQPVNKGKHQYLPDTPWDFYNRVTATIQKYIGGLSAKDVDQQPYGVVLQQLEMVADEAAEMEKMKHKK